VDRLITDYIQRYKTETRKMGQRPTRRARTRQDRNLLLRWQERNDQLGEASNHLHMAIRCQRRGHPQTVVRAILRSVHSQLYPLRPEQRSRANMEHWTMPAVISVTRKHSSPSGYQGDFHDHEW